MGGFRLVREVGSGGFGTVYLGEDSAGRQAAIKLVHPHLARDPQVRRYFSQELVNARRVQGFCLAQVLDGDAEAEPPWIATEYVPGPTLAQAIDQDGPRTGGDLQRLAVQTITALSAIHAAGVVHRDLKPDNILLGPDGPRVIDFGIARALDADTSSATRIGTLGYMSPEQIEGTTLGPAADLFAWGSVIVHAATGAEAFAASTQASRINRVLNHPPQTGNLADPLLGIVLACTAKDPDQRPTARQVLDMLLTGRVATPPLAKTRILRTEPEEDEEARVRRTAEAGDARAMFKLGFLLKQQGEKEEAEQWYRKAIAADGTHALAMNNLGHLLEQRGEAGEAEQWYRKAIAADGNLALAMNNLGVLLQERGEKEEAEQWYRKAVTANGNHFRAMTNLGILLEQRGEAGEAEQWYRKAVTANGTYARAMFKLGFLLKQQGEKEEAEQWYRKAIAADGTHALAMNNLGHLLEQRGEAGEAEQWYRKAIAADGNLALAMNNLGVLLQERGEKEEAEQWYRKAVTANGNHFRAMTNLGILLEQRGEAGEAEQWYRKAAEAKA
ncbi:tetratricopeptide repeat protein [Nocardiopsis sp. CNT-189]|uniref:tetratricopeptide repeat protein n=1 Tax=Nocardiopsis oceanisediminis TaxID=2816862 RepID=UPI003B3B1656